MFNVSVSVKQSEVHGKGLFLDEDVEKGGLIYTQEPEKEQVYSSQELAMLPKKRQREVRHFAPKTGGVWRLAHDEIVYVNHARPANMTSRAGKIYANENISSGIELTQDYRELEGELRPERDLS